MEYVNGIGLHLLVIISAGHQSSAHMMPREFGQLGVLSHDIPRNAAHIHGCVCMHTYNTHTL